MVGKMSKFWLKYKSKSKKFFWFIQKIVGNTICKRLSFLVSRMVGWLVEWLDGYFLTLWFRVDAALGL